MRPRDFTWAYLLPAAAGAGVLLGGLWTLTLPVFAWIVLPVLELVLPLSAPRLTPEQEEEVRQDPGFEHVLTGLVLSVLAVSAAFVVQVGRGALVGWELVGAIIAVGTCAGGVGINVGHELSHRRAAWRRALGKLSLLPTLYQHFSIEHVRGHHGRVGTEADPASARRDEPLPAFWVRSLVLGYLHAWKLETDRLRRRERSPWTWSNEMVRNTVVQAVVVGAITVFAGPLALGAFLASALFGALMLETVNYFEHYGLRRVQDADGRYEQVASRHSWDSEHLLSRVLLLQLTLHADHHAHPLKPYQTLRLHDQAHQLPTGYPGMILLALVPPLFFKVMNPRLRPEVEAA
ncbi:MAG: alkane 1-monooxygenase [Acidobacteriota bacterium]